MTRTTWTPQQLVTLRKNLSTYFSEDELRTICFDLQNGCAKLKDLEYDSLGGTGLAGKARELVKFVTNRSCIPELVEKCQELRPNVEWELEDTGPISLPPQPDSGRVAPASNPLQSASAKSPVPRPNSGRQVKVVIGAALGFAGVVMAAYLSYMGIKWQVEAPVRATQVAEVRLTQVALSATPTATSTSTSTPSLTSTSTPTPTPTSTPTLLVTTTIRLDALAVPEGWMSGDQANPTKYISVTTLFEGCHAGPGCMRWTFKPGGVWANVLWWPPGCRLDTLNTCGIDLLAQGGLSAIDRLTFWARGDKGGEIIEFKIGGGAALPKSARSRKATLESDWRQYEIDLTGLDLTNASGLFIWAAADQENPRGAVFYLDSILFEGHRR